MTRGTGDKDKVSLTLDGDLVADARRRSGPGGLSAYVNEALRLKLQRDRLGSLLAEMDREAGAIPAEVMEEVRRAWPAREPAPSGRRARRSA
ncbi:MAG: hypothetical protein U0V73_08615 [Acidimicrobiia bacterium]